MILFFKNIRHRLLRDSKLSKYLLYAAGEIVLVVAGILIALSINNWNEQRKTNRQVAKYLSNLELALQEDISSLNANITLNKTRLRGIFYLLEHAGLDTGRFTELEWIDITENDPGNAIWNAPFPVSRDREFTHLSFSLLGRGFGGVSLNKSVIKELYATGTFSSIQDPALKTGIAGYYSFLAQRLEGFAIEEHEQWANETTRFLRDTYGIFTLDVSGPEDPIALISGKQDVENHLRYLALEVNYHCIWAETARKKALHLVQRINSQNTPDR